MISIAMTTYNGERYLENQLKSFVKQTLQPDEIVVVDDCSTDSTIDILDKFRKEYSHVKWKILKNSYNMGWKKNFAKAIKNTQGDIIFLADQDDYWCKDKIQIMVNIMKGNFKIKILAAELEVFESSEFKCEIDSNLSNRGNINIVKKQFSSNFYMTHFPGCNMAFRSELKKWFSTDLWNGEQPHDEFLWTIGQLFDSAYILPFKVLCYLRHPNAATASRGHSQINQIRLLKDKIVCVDTISKIIKCCDIDNKKEKEQIVSQVLDFLKLRIDFISQPSIPKCIQVFKHYGLYEKKKFLFVDIYCAIH